MKRRYLPRGTETKIFPLRLTGQERVILKKLAANANKSVAGYIRDRIFPRGGYDLHAARHPLAGLESR